MLRVGPAVIGLDVVDCTKVTFAVESVEQPGTALDIVTGLRINPGQVQLVVRAQIEGLDPNQQIVATQLPPAQQISITDTAVVGINQLKTAMAATATVKSVFHRLYTGTELLM